MQIDTLLKRRHHTPRPDLQMADEITLTLARCHEVCGTARRVFALWAGSKTTGPVIWIRPGWVPDHLYPAGVRCWMEPGRLLMMRCRRPEDILWSMEEALRSGAAQLVVAELPSPPALTPVRRLHLAAETGSAEGTHAPVGLLVTPDNGGAPGVESRWHMAARHHDTTSAWHLERRRARHAGPKAWHVQHDKILTLSPMAMDADLEPT